jgi:uncharacterized membrane protein (UPF0127 family)
MRTPVMMLAVFVAAAALAQQPAFAQSVITKAQPHLRTEPLTIRTSARTIAFHVEVARTSGEQEAGLMFRTSVPPHGGMIFPMTPVRDATFWMKNTVIPLDMLFIRTDGTIARITTAKALDESIDDSGEPVAAVLELGAGRAKALGIQEGDKVVWQGLAAAAS